MCHQSNRLIPANPRNFLIRDNLIGGLQCRRSGQLVKEGEAINLFDVDGVMRV